MEADIIHIAEYLSSKNSSQLIRNAIKVPSVEDQIVRLNLGQLAKFRNSKGDLLSDIGGEYSEATQRRKGVGAKDVNLRDTGDYWATFEANPIDGGYEIDSNPLKGDTNLILRYGDDVEGLNKINEEKANDIIENQIWKTAMRDI